MTHYYLQSVRAVSAVHVCLPESEQTTRRPAVNVTSLPAQTNSTSRNCPCTSAAPAATAAPAFSLGLLTVSWTSVCEGNVLIFYLPSSSSSPVCFNSETKIKSVLGNVCQNKTGCEGTTHWHKGINTQNGSNITESGAKDGTSCDTLRVKCSGWSTVCVRPVVHVISWFDVLHSAKTCCSLYPQDTFYLKTPSFCHSVQHHC